MISNTEMPSNELEKIFKFCDADRSGDLHLPELRHALQALGLYPSDEEISNQIEELALQVPLRVADFHMFVENLESTSCKRGMRTVPYALRGLTLRQLKAILEGVLEDKWLSSVCEQFNDEHEVDIQDEDKNTFKKLLNLYSIDEYFVKPTTNRVRSARDGIPEAVLEAAEVPAAPGSNCCFSQLLNPEGLRVDYFVSHFWGHSFQKTVEALSNFAQGIYKNIGKSSPEDVTFWVCLFALNQHQAAEEVGETPEDGPFNSALSHAKYGAVMVMDGDAKPMGRIWCLYEVGRAKEFKQEFQIIVDEGDLEKASIGTLEKISESLLNVRASNADASNALDKLKIHYRILDPTYKKAIHSLEFFKLATEDDDDTEDFYEDFDQHICSLIGTPLLTAGLKLESEEVCMRALGMGAMTTVAHLEQLTEFGVDLKMKVETRLGSRNLPHVFAQMGQADQLKYLLDRGADVNIKDVKDMTPFHCAAQGGHVNVCELLLDKGSDVDAKDEDGMISLHYAATYGHANVCGLLLDKGADSNAKEYGGMTSLHIAATAGHASVCELLLDNGADVNAKEEDDSTPLHYAATYGQASVCELLLDKGADVDPKDEDGMASLHYAATTGHASVCSLLLDKGADVDVKNEDGRTSLHLAAVTGHKNICKLLVDRGADINAKDDDGDTPLDAATEEEQEEVRTFLLGLGAT